MLEFFDGGRRVSQNEFFENLTSRAIDAGMKQVEQRVHDAASSIIDPDTRKHAEVFLRRTDPTGLILTARGSPAFARELEKRLAHTLKTLTASKGRDQLTSAPTSSARKSSNQQLQFPT